MTDSKQQSDKPENIRERAEARAEKREGGRTVGATPGTRGRGNNEHDIRYDTGDTGRMINEPSGQIADMTRLVDEEAVNAVLGRAEEERGLRDEPARAALEQQVADQAEDPDKTGRRAERKS